jgi:hypothetical protein
MRVCSKCAAERPDTEFYTNYAQCKGCVRARVAAHRAANLERVRAYDRERAKRPKTKTRISLIAKRWRETNPERRKAQHALLNAIRGGLLVRPSRCSRCRRAGRIEAHHHDYTKPLVVEWLCKPCHAKADAERRAA